MADTFAQAASSAASTPSNAYSKLTFPTPSAQVQMVTQVVSVPTDASGNASLAVSYGATFTVTPLALVTLGQAATPGMVIGISARTLTSCTISIVGANSSTTVAVELLVVGY